MRTTSTVMSVTKIRTATPPPTAPAMIERGVLLVFSSVVGSVGKVEEALYCGPVHYDQMKKAQEQ